MSDSLLAQELIKTIKDTVDGSDSLSLLVSIVGNDVERRILLIDQFDVTDATHAIRVELDAEALAAGLRP